MGIVTRARTKRDAYTATRVPVYHTTADDQRAVCQSFRIRAHTDRRQTANVLNQQEIRFCQAVGALDIYYMDYKLA